MLKSKDGRFEYLDKDGNELPADATIRDVGRFKFVCRNPNIDPTMRGHCDVNCANAGYNRPTQNWRLVGTLDEPTLAPSINCRDCWHGFIEAGVFVNCSKQPEAEQ
jgi:hypothetical protein